MIEPKYCFNCDSDADFYVDWAYSEDLPDIHRTFMCRNCADAFRFGQLISDNIQSIDNLTD